MVPISEFSEEGVDVGSFNRNLTYLYGLSDFFSFTFEDTETLNLMLEAGAVEASEIYSKFLQMTSSLTISDIQDNVGSSIKLVLISEADQIGVIPKYKVNLPIASAKFLANRPFLPTETLQEGVDFRIVQETETTASIQFARPLSEYRFSKRATESGIDEYAIWMTDVKVDEQLMYKHYGKILGVAPEISSEQFSNFIYGLHYLYFNGPTLQVLEQGMNLVLGIPLPRGPGVVLDIRNNVESDRYVVITDTDQYLLPSGINPTVSIGDSIDTGTSIAKWIELRDYVADGKWWINVSIPPSIIRDNSNSQNNRFAREGSRFDYIMTNYLKTHTFLVRVNIGAFRDNKYFPYLSDILYNSKPSYAQPIYVWKLDVGSDDLSLTIEELSFSSFTVVSEMTAVNCQPINQTAI